MKKCCPPPEKKNIYNPLFILKPGGGVNTIYKFPGPRSYKTQKHWDTRDNRDKTETGDTTDYRDTSYKRHPMFMPLF